MSTEKIMYKLECGDIVLAPSFLVNGQLTCYVEGHGKRKIIDIPIYEWRIRCKNCKYARWCGYSETMVITLGTMHVARTRGHETYSEYCQRPAAVNTRKKFRSYHGISESTNV